MRKVCLITLTIIVGSMFITACDNSDNSAKTSKLTGKISFDMSNLDGSNHNIYLMDSNVDNLVQITKGAIDTYPSFSPDGDKILFNSFRDNNNLDIYVINTDGTGEKRLTDDRGADGQPSWSPNGKKIVFYSSRDFDSLNERELYIMNSDGLEQTRLTSNNRSIICPRWSPDGTKIVFHSDFNGRFDIWTMNIDGTNWVKLTNGSPSIDYFAPRWSPDGRKILFESSEDEIYMMNADGTNQVKLTNNTSMDISPTWSPDGKQIAFISNRNNTQDNGLGLYIMNVDGSNQVMLMSTDKKINWIDWSY